jgi:hypothetical protein
MSYSRSNPSPRYVELQSLYRTLHETGEAHLGIPPEMTFPGTSLAPQAGRIKKLIDRTGAQIILDYGSGKGRQYDPHVITDDAGVEWPDILAYWNVDEIVCYDPGYPPFSKVPTGKFDGVIATDVLEHCPEDDMSWIVEEIFAFAERFVFANVACYPALKRLPTGENAHCTVRPDAWWRGVFEAVAARHGGLVWEVWIHACVQAPEGERYVESRIGNT